MKIEIDIHRTTPTAHTYRANRTRGLFNVEDDRATTFRHRASIDTGDTWQIGLVVGPSGSGKSSIGNWLAEQGEASWWDPSWDDNAPIVDEIGPDQDYDDVTGALAAVGLGDVPAWLRPYRILSTGERFRASLARLCIEGAAADKTWIVDEYTSVVDRQIARVGSLAFAKTWRRTGGRVVLLSCHHDIVDWLQPDWIHHTSETGSLSRVRTEEGDEDLPHIDTLTVRAAPAWTYA